MKSPYKAAVKSMGISDIRITIPKAKMEIASRKSMLTCPELSLFTTPE